MKKDPVTAPFWAMVPLLTVPEKNPKGSVSEIVPLKLDPV
jgi:hypothetical protein